MPQISRTQLKEKSSTQDRATYLQFLLAWPDGLRYQQARQELPHHSPCSRGYDPTVTSHPSLSWLVRPLKHCLNGPSPSNLQSLVWQYPGKSFWIGYCFSAPCSLLISFKVEVAWHFSHVPKYSQSGTQNLEERKAFTWRVQKHLKPFPIKSARNTPYTLDGTTSFSELHLPSGGRGRQMSHSEWEPGAVFWASVFLTSRKHAKAHTDCQEPQGDHTNSLPLDTEIPSLSSQEYTRTHTLQPRTA
jgi:hypothetical protein